MNKMLLKTAILSVLAFTPLTPGFAAADDKPMTDMKALVDYSHVDVMTMDGMDLVPLRQVAESIGYDVMWEGSDRSITLTAGGMTDKGMMDKGMTDKGMAYKVMIKIGSMDCMVGMDRKMLIFTPVIIHDKTYVTKTFVDAYLSAHMMMK